MRTESLTAAKNGLSRLLREVRAGARIRILVHGEAVADLVPISGADPAAPASFGELEGAIARGLVTVGDAPLDERLLQPPPGDGAGTPASELILEERGEER